MTLCSVAVLVVTVASLYSVNAQCPTVYIVADSQPFFTNQDWSTINPINLQAERAPSTEPPKTTLKRIPPPRPRCPFNWDPLCGTDGITYPNYCHLRKAMRLNPTLRLAHTGRCEKKPPCGCPKVYQPVCGTDDKTYDNYCILECARRNNPSLKINYPGECIRPKA